MPKLKADFTILVAIESAHFRGCYLCVDCSDMVTDIELPHGGGHVNFQFGYDEKGQLYLNRRDKDGIFSIESMKWPGKCLRMDRGGGHYVNCQNGCFGWEEFWLEQNFDDGTYSFMSKEFNLWLMGDARGINSVQDGIRGCLGGVKKKDIWERFIIHPLGK